MATMKVYLPGSLERYVAEQVIRRGYHTKSEYIRDLIRDDQERQKLRELVLNGPASPVQSRADAKYFRDLRQRVRRRTRR